MAIKRYGSKIKAKINSQDLLFSDENENYTFKQAVDRLNRKKHTMSTPNKSGWLLDKIFENSNEKTSEFHIRYNKKNYEECIASFEKTKDIWDLRESISYLKCELFLRYHHIIKKHC